MAALLLTLEDVRDGKLDGRGARETYAVDGTGRETGLRYIR